MPDIQTLLVQVRQEAERATFPIDIPIYEAAKKDPHEPILYAGNLIFQKKDLESRLGNKKGKSNF